MEIYEEPTKQWRNIQGHNALEKMYEDPCRWGAVFQSYSQLTMTDIHVKPHTLPVKLMERSLYSGRYCFIENLHRSKVIPELDYVVLCSWFDWLIQLQNIKVDLIVYLRTEPEALLERIKACHRPVVSLEYLQQLHDLHEQWLVHKTSFPVPASVLIIDGNKDLMSMQKIYEEEKSKILFGLGTM